VPWALLPVLRDRVVSVSPSASAWLRARSLPEPASGRVTFVAGPGLGTGAGEIEPLARNYPGCLRLTGEQAGAEATLAALDGAWLAHLAAHGSLRLDNPLFSALHLADGPLTVHDFERLGRAPHRLVLPCCNSGVGAPVGADELLGLVSSLMPLGAAGVLASVVPINDAATVPLMLALHSALQAGKGLPEALLLARRATAGDPVAVATGYSFTAFGI
jgi:CHAT domain-containing protein